MGGGGDDSDANGMSGGEMELDDDDDDDDDEVHISFACLLDSCCPQHLKAFGLGCQGARRQMCRSWTSVTTENCLLAAWRVSQCFRVSQRCTHGLVGGRTVKFVPSLLQLDIERLPARSTRQAHPRAARGRGRTAVRDSDSEGEDAEEGTGGGRAGRGDRAELSPSRKSQRKRVKVGGNTIQLSA